MLKEEFDLITGMLEGILNINILGVVALKAKPY
jgi:hypothetical protein